MFEKIIGILLSAITFISSTILGVTPKYEAFSNIAYGAGERNVIDIYVPADAYEKEARAIKHVRQNKILFDYLPRITNVKSLVINIAKILQKNI